MNLVYPDINIVYPILALSARKDAIINLNANVFAERPYFMDKKHLEFKLLDLNCFDLHIFVNDQAKKRCLITLAQVCLHEKQVVIVQQLLLLLPPTGVTIKHISTPAQ